MQSKLGIIIVLFNTSNLIIKQIELIAKFCQDDHDIVVIDNSSNPQKAEEIRAICAGQPCRYIKTNSTDDFSQSHASACNFAYSIFREEYEYFLFLDHDNFPVMNFSIKEILKDKLMGGVGQARTSTVNQCRVEKFYFWPGCFILKNKDVDRDRVDFYTNEEYGLDTGGNLYRLIDDYGLDNCANFDQYDVPNPEFPQYYFNLITSQKHWDSHCSFMHFINASNWSNQVKNEDRIISLLRILDKYVKENTK